MARFVIVLLTLVLAAGVFLAGLKQQWWPVPRHWNPFMALHLDDPVTPVTRWKLRRLGDRPEACRAVLNTAPEGTLDALPLEDYTPVESCPLTNVVRVRSTVVAFNNSFVARCPLVAAWSLYERRRLQPLAREYFDQPVAEVWHYGTFACRNIYHREDDRRSDHATASALDVAAFSLADGTRVSVQDHWDDEGDKGAFLHAAFDGACGLFGTALGPDYNAAHADHFHFGLRGFGICR
ncbi:hypothetical protein ASALC70_01289 [Alcanivorax sp. ALC70]|nr:extensin [Alcanivorax sp.]MBI53350.1 extensin [Alcanivorax sp.]UWN49094.1 hypothetical protein ASALC70_01289 [Alcanivorax sp. ALC70]HCE40836.1 extensin [Alcanivorax sp.]|tara:strand:+ start:33286 stop:33996 length:711 start_codon:yes stop_codon:yes gene_type:complete